MSKERPIYHVALASEWAQARRGGHYDGSTLGASVTEVGFVHCSTREQVELVTRALYRDPPAPLVLLEIDPELIAGDGVSVRWERASDDEPMTFPHVYGPLRPEWVVSERALSIGTDGYPIIEF